MSPRIQSATNLLTALTFLLLISFPMVLHMLQDSAGESQAENRRLAAAPSLTTLQSDWNGFPETVNAWMRDHFGLRRNYIKIGFELEKILPSSADFKAVRGDDGWLFNTLNGALALHQGLLPFGSGEADDWLDGLLVLQTEAEQSGAIFVAFIAPNKHTIYPERLSTYPRQIAGETRLDEVNRRARERGMPLLNLRTELESAKEIEQIYYQTDSHWNDIGAYYAFNSLRDLLLVSGVDVPEIPHDALTRKVKTDFQGDLYRLIGEENGAPETIERISVNPDVVGPTAGSVLVYGDSFSSMFLKYLEATFSTVDFVDNNAGSPDLSKIEPGKYNVILFQIVERYLSRPLSPVAMP